MRLSKTLGYLDRADRGDALVDIGCGDGHLINLLERKRFKNIVGGEYSLTRIKHALDRHVRLTPLVNLDAMAIPFQDARFGLVVSVAVIEHVADQDRFISELSRITRRGGKVIILTDCFFYRLDQWLGTYVSRFPIDCAPFPPTLLTQCHRNQLRLVACDAWGTRFHHCRILLNRLFGGFKFDYPCGGRPLSEITAQPAANRERASLLDVLRTFYRAECLFVFMKESATV